MGADSNSSVVRGGSSVVMCMMRDEVQLCGGMFVFRYGGTLANRCRREGRGGGVGERGEERRRRGGEGTGEMHEKS